MKIRFARWLAALITALGLMLLAVAVALLASGIPAGVWAVLAAGYGWTASAWSWSAQAAGTGCRSTVPSRCATTGSAWAPSCAGGSTPSSARALVLVIGAEMARSRDGGRHRCSALAG